MAEPSFETKHFMIRGIVQGVGFRRFVEREALTLGLSGWVRNLSDGRVEAVACGSPEAMKQFLTRLNEGPPLAEVEEVQVKEAHEKIDFSRRLFVVR